MEMVEGKDRKKADEHISYSITEHDRKRHMRHISNIKVMTG